MPPIKEQSSQKIEEHNIRIIKGKGSWVYDKNDNHYLYVNTAVPTVGISNPEVLSVIEEQYRKLSFSSTCGQTHDLLNPLSEKLIKLSGDKFSKVFFTLDGSGAVETAMKLVRQYFSMKGNENKRKFISFDGNYHGTTLGAGSVTNLGIKEVFGTTIEGCINVPSPGLYRPPVNKNIEEIENYCLTQLEEKITKEDPDTIGAILIEPIQGVNGVIMFPERFYHSVCKIAQKYNIKIIVDEVTTGLGRIGYWTASEYYKIEPDFLVVSKGLTGGYFPMGATLFTEEIEKTIFGCGNIFLHGSTQCGHPVGCSVALAIINYLEENNILSNVNEKGHYIITKFHEHLDNHKNVGDIRGKGLMMAIEFVENKESKEQISFEWGNKLSHSLHKKGIIGNYFNSTLVLYPPLNISEEEADYLIDNIVSAIQEITK